MAGPTEGTPRAVQWTTKPLCPAHPAGHTYLHRPQLSGDDFHQITIKEGGAGDIQHGGAALSSLWHNQSHWQDLSFGRSFLTKHSEAPDHCMNPLRCRCKSYWRGCP